MKTNFEHIKQSGFKAPDGYFESLEESVFNKLNASSNLDSLKNTGFNVPDHYFSTIEANVLDALKKDQKEVKVIHIFSKRNVLYYSGIAAAIVLMISIFTPNSEFSFDSIETELVESYIATQNINASDLASLWNETDFSDVTFDDYEFLNETVEDYIFNDATIEDLLIE
jgi:hypothetical protein